ncbi:MAG: deaminase [Nitrospinota bacterium]
MIIGLTGENCSGKGTVAGYLKKKGFYCYSLSDVIREELEEEGNEVTREALIKKGNELRQRYGPSILAKRILSKIESDKNYIIDSIRNPAEVEELRSREDFILIHIYSSKEKRFERMRLRNREGDPKTFDAFMKIEEAEARNADKTKQQLVECMKIADKRVVNDLDFNHLYKEIDNLLEELSLSLKDYHQEENIRSENSSPILEESVSNNGLARPTWDEYFMRIAKVVSSRSNCMKRRVASVIVKDRRIVSTGYNGTPRGTKNCNEGGCPRCNSYAKPGTRLEECLCSHGEENAIVQAAYHGISIKGATIYTTFAPCLMCTKMIINSGMVEVVYNIDYPLNETAFKLLKEAGIRLRQYHID